MGVSMADTTLYPAERLAAGGQPARLRSISRLLLLIGFGLYFAALVAAWTVAVRYLPDHLDLTLAGRTLHLHDLHQKIASNALMLSAILPFALWVEWMTVGWQESSLRRLLSARSSSTKTDLAILVLGQGRVLDVMAKAMLLGASFISGEAIRQWLKVHTGVWIDPSGLPFAVQLPLFFAVYTFFDYWTHRLDHWKYFWPLHRYHHAAEEFCVVTAERQHPAQFAGIFVINLPLAMLGADPAVMIWVNVLVATIGLLIHSRIDSDWGFIGRWVLQSPNHHRLHHKFDMTRPTGHFAIAPMWDHLFGTFYGDEGIYAGGGRELPLGVDRAYRHGWWVMPDLMRDYWDFWRGWLVRGKAHL